jgi:hypothetical protein
LRPGGCIVCKPTIRSLNYIFILEKRLHASLLLKARNYIFIQKVERRNLKKKKFRSSSNQHIINEGSGKDEEMRDNHVRPSRTNISGCLEASFMVAIGFLPPATLLFKPVVPLSACQCQSRGGLRVCFCRNGSSGAELPKYLFIRDER